MSLTIIYPELPPTSNHIYIRGTMLTSKARKYAEDFAKFAAQNYLADIGRLNPNSIYAVHLRFYFESLLNASFDNPRVAPSKRAKTRYKRLDLDNRIKLLTDCVRDAIGVDDSHIFAASQEKHQDPANPHVEITVQEVAPELFGV